MDKQSSFSRSILDYSLTDLCLQLSFLSSLGFPSLFFSLWWFRDWNAVNSFGWCLNTLSLFTGVAIRHYEILLGKSQKIISFSRSNISYLRIPFLSFSTSLLVLSFLKKQHELVLVVWFKLILIEIMTKSTYLSTPIMTESNFQSLQVYEPFFVLIMLHCSSAMEILFSWSQIKLLGVSCRQELSDSLVYCLISLGKLKIRK